MKIAPVVESVDALRKFPSAGILVNQAQSWLASVGQRPFFLWLHLMDPHAPYYPPNEAYRDLAGRDIEPGRARYLNEYWNRSDLTPSALSGKRDEIVQLYDGGIRWVDRQIAGLVDSLRQSHLWDDCVLALTADHGEEFLEHGGRYHSPVRLSEEIVRVPLLVRVPGERGAKVPATPMSHLHLAPTLLEIMGVQAPSAFQGRSLGQTSSAGLPGTIPRSPVLRASVLPSLSAPTVVRIPSGQKAEAHRGSWRFAMPASSWSCGLSPERLRTCTTWKPTQGRCVPSPMGLHSKPESDCCKPPMNTWRKRLQPEIP